MTTSADSRSDLRIAIDIPNDLSYGGDEDWTALIPLRDGDGDQATILGVTYTADTADDAEAAIVAHWTERLTDAAEKLGVEVMFTGDAAEAHDWVSGQDGDARIDAYNAVWSAA